MPLTLTPSETCYLCLTSIEGIELKAYDDQGVLAIASGHSNRSGLPPFVSKGMTITKKQAEAIARQDLLVYALRLYERLNNTKVFGWLTQGLWDALVHTSINTGTVGLLDREPLNLRPYLLRGEWTTVVHRIRFAIPPTNDKLFLGIARRREMEARMAEGKNADFCLLALKQTKAWYLKRKP